MRCCLVVPANIFPCFSCTRWHCLVLFHSLVLEVSLGESVLPLAHQWHLCIMHEGFMDACKRPLTQKWSCLFEVLWFFLVAHLLWGEPHKPADRRNLDACHGVKPVFCLATCCSSVIFCILTGQSNRLPRFRIILHVKEELESYRHTHFLKILQSLKWFIPFHWTLVHPIKLRK